MKKSAFVTLFGLLIMFSGCVPFGKAISNALNVNEVLNESITLNKLLITSIIKVDTQNLILPAIKIHLTTDEISRYTNGTPSEEYTAKYRFPIEFTITNSNGKKLYEHKGLLDWKQGSRSYDLNSVDARHGEVIVEIDLDKYKIPAPGKIKVSVLISKDSYYYANLKSAKLIIYDNVHTHTATILTGVGILFIGILVFVLGLVMLVIYQTKNTNKNNSSLTINSDNAMNDDLNNNMRPALTKTEINTSAMLCHLATFAGYVIPFGGILGPLIVWQIKKNDAPFIDRHGIAAMNFHLSMAIYYFISFLTMFVIIGFFLAPALAIFELVIVIIASIKANNGEEFTYPLAIGFIKPQPN